MGANRSCPVCASFASPGWGVKAKGPPPNSRFAAHRPGKSAEAGGKTLCRIGKDGRLDTGLPMVGAVLMEAEGETRKILQIMLPLGILLPRGTRVLIDNDEQGAMVMPIIVCAGGGCMAQTEANADMVAKLKKGQNLYVQAYNMQQSVFTLAVPLADFAKAYDGPPTDPKVFEEQQKKLQDELQRRANEARQKLQQQQPAQSQAPGAKPQ